MFGIIVDSVGILCLIKILDMMLSLVSTWAHHHLDRKLGRVPGVRVGRRGVEDGGRAGGHHEEDAEAVCDEDIV